MNTTQFEEDTLIDAILSKTWSLILWNDDVTTFDCVISTLMEVCGHTHEQSEQLAMIVHFNGKAVAKKGAYEDLEVMKEKIESRGITVTLEENE